MAATARAATTAPAPHQALRFFTAGSVDDGKSTLIGRLLYDSRAILADQLDQLHARGGRSAAHGPGFDLSLLTDGLEAEREQGITIDVAWRYFATPARKFVIADAPGHEQYTRNMVTAAAGSDAAVVLVDLTKLDPTHGTPALLAQTRRHALLAQLLRVPAIVFAVNKIDAVADPAAAFAATARALEAFAAEAGFVPAGIVPVSALRGDNVTAAAASDWYRGPTLLSLLESLPCAATADTDAAGRSVDFALPVQYVARLDDGRGAGTRVLWGRVAAGRVRAGDALQVFPSGETARVAALHGSGGALAEGDAVAAGTSAGIVLDRPLDVSRGDWLAAPGTQRAAQRFVATLAWLDVDAAEPGRRYWLRHGHRWVQGRIVAIEHRRDVHTLRPEAADRLAVNDIGRVGIELQQPLPLIPYATSRVGGALIVVDAATHRTSGALLVESVA